MYNQLTISQFIKRKCRPCLFQNQSSTLLLLVVQHVALLTKKEIQQELVKGLEVPIVQCLKACDLESLVVLSQMLMMQADNKANVAANALQIEVSANVKHCVFFKLIKLAKSLSGILASALMR